MPDPPLAESWAAYARALGLELQRRRLERGLNQDDLALAAGIARTHYQQLERGYWKVGTASNPSLRVLIAIALALDTVPAELLPPVDGLVLPLAP